MDREAASRTLCDTRLAATTRERFLPGETVTVLKTYSHLKTDNVPNHIRTTKHVLISRLFPRHRILSRGFASPRRRVSHTYARIALQIVPGYRDNILFSNKWSMYFFSGKNEGTNEYRTLSSIFRPFARYPGPLALGFRSSVSRSIRSSSMTRNRGYRVVRTSIVISIEGKRDGSGTTAVKSTLVEA